MLPGISMVTILQYGEILSDGDKSGLDSVSAPMTSPVNKTRQNDSPDTGLD